LREVSRTSDNLETKVSVITKGRLVRAGRSELGRRTILASIVLAFVLFVCAARLELRIPLAQAHLSREFWAGFWASLAISTVFWLIGWKLNKMLGAVEESVERVRSDVTAISRSLQVSKDTRPENAKRNGGI
jgi:hypothetical protein